MTSRDVRNTLTRDAAVSRYITLAITLAITLETLGITTHPHVPSVLGNTGK
jgi:hypothetical protein